MTLTIYSVEYISDAGRREHVVYDPVSSPRGVPRAVREAIADNDDAAIIQQTDMDPESLYRWATSRPADDIWYLSRDGTYAQRNAWTFVRSEERVVREYEDAVTEVIPRVDGNDPDGFWPLVDLGAEDASQADLVQDFPVAVKELETSLGALQTAYLEGRQLCPLGLDVAYWLGRLLVASGHVDAANGHSIR